MTIVPRLVHTGHGIRLRKRLAERQKPVQFPDWAAVADALHRAGVSIRFQATYVGLDYQTYRSFLCHWRSGRSRGPKWNVGQSMIAMYAEVFAKPPEMCGESPMVSLGTLSAGDENFCPRCGASPLSPMRYYCEPCTEEVRRLSAITYAELSLDAKRKATARAKAKMAVVRGKLTPCPCEVCGSKAEMHHDDYSKPLAVRWLCRTHHLQHHKNVPDVTA